MQAAPSHLSDLARGFAPEPDGAARADKQDADLSDSAAFQQNTDCQQGSQSAQCLSSEMLQRRCVSRTFRPVAGTYFVKENHARP